MKDSDICQQIVLLVDISLITYQRLSGNISHACTIKTQFKYLMAPFLAECDLSTPCVSL